MRILALALPALFIACAADGAAAAGEDYCRHSDQHTVVLVDRTTAYDDIDRELFQASLPRLEAVLEPGERLSIHTIGAEDTRSRKMFDACLPGCPDAGGLSGWLFGTCRSTQARVDRAAFLREAGGIIRDMLNEVQEHPHSAIAETAASVCRAYAESDRPVTMLVVFSDLLENSAMLPWPEFAATAPDGAAAVAERLGIAGALDGAEVVAYGFGRSHDPGRPALAPALRQRLAGFWTAFFEHGGATAVRIGQRWE